MLTYMGSSPITTDPLGTGSCLAKTWGKIMAHFAQIDDNLVINVIVVANEQLIDDNGVEQEALGVQFCQSLLGGTWIQTSYNSNIRKQYASIGYTYDPIADVFVSPQPFPSWLLDSNHDWQAPTPMPTEEGKFYQWSEETLSWVETSFL
jgi:hypothetical protein